MTKNQFWKGSTFFVLFSFDLTLCANAGNFKCNSVHFFAGLEVNQMENGLAVITSEKNVAAHALSSNAIHALSYGYCHFKREGCV